jgi:hypothetical protein
MRSIKCTFDLFIDLNKKSEIRRMAQSVTAYLKKNNKHLSTSCVVWVVNSSRLRHIVASHGY